MTKRKIRSSLRPSPLPILVGTMAVRCSDDGAEPGSSVGLEFAVSPGPKGVGTPVSPTVAAVVRDVGG